MKLADAIFKRNDAKMTSPYGERIHPVTKEKSFHQGVDYAPYGKTDKEKQWEQYAIEDGVVYSAGVDNSKTGQGALFAWVEYQRLKLRLLHYHLNEVFVKKGQKVNSDTVIGTTGTTGRSTGIHLHLGAKRQNGDKWVYFNPLEFDFVPLVKNEEVIVEKTKNKKTLYLDKSAVYWRVYPLNKVAKVGNEVGKLAPRKFGGLKYEIIEDLGENLYVIQTATFGKVKIYAVNGTQCKIV